MDGMDETGTQKRITEKPDRTEEPNGVWNNRHREIYLSVKGERVMRDREHAQFMKASRTDTLTCLNEMELSLRCRKWACPLGSRTGLVRHRQKQSCGVGGFGFALVHKNPKLPRHGFFQADQCMAVRLHHNNLSVWDDAMLDARVTRLKFCDADVGGPLDLIFTTGKLSQFYNIHSFQEFSSAIRGSEDAYMDWVFKNPINLKSTIEATRRAPESFYDQHYYCHVTYQYICTDGKKRLARFRLVPADDVTESGLPDSADQELIWVKSRCAEDPRPRHYLREEYIKGLSKSALKYKLQIQIHACNGKTNRRMLNASEEWDSTCHAWEELADVVITGLLPTSVIRKTEFTVANRPASMGVLRSLSVHDFSSVVDAHVNELDDLLGVASVKTSNSTRKKQVKYKICTLTGDVTGAGTDADVSLTLIGTQGRTVAINIDNLFRDDFERGRKDEFNVKAAEVGDLLEVQIHLSATSIGHDWYLLTVNVENTSTHKQFVFPCYRWLTTKQPFVILRTTEVVLSHQEGHVYGLYQRRFEMNERRRVYGWDTQWQGLPGRMLLPDPSHIPRHHKCTMTSWPAKMARVQSARNAVSLFSNLFSDWDPLQNGPDLVPNGLVNTRVVEHVSATWKEDAEFGRQFLNGMNPTRISRVRQIPEHCHVTEAIMEPFLTRGMSLQEEIDSGHIYMASYPEFEDIQCNAGTFGRPVRPRYMVSPLCLFYSDKDGDLLPIAIQLHQKPGEDNPIWTPRDSEADWTFAKMWVRATDAHVHMINEVYLKLYLIPEAVAVATMRSLPTVHPLCKLLLPHLNHLIQINFDLREQVFKPSGLIEKLLCIGDYHESLLQKFYNRFSLNSLHFPNDLSSRGVNDANKLRNYFFRDDGLKLWDAIYKLVCSLLGLYYHDDSDVSNDQELQNWTDELRLKGLAVSENKSDHGIPKSLRTFGDLADLVTSIIFTTTGRYSALTSGILDHYTCLPNTPSLMTCCPPTSKGSVTGADIAAALPTKRQASQALAIAGLMTRSLKAETVLGEYPGDWFTDEASSSATHIFQESLQAISAVIRERNADLTVPYAYLLPEHIPCGVHS